MPLDDPDYRTERYRVTLDRRRLVAVVTGVDGRLWLKLRLLSSVDCLDGPDETIGEPVVEHTTDAGGMTVTVEAASSRWRSRTSQLRCTPDGLAVDTTVTGTGRPTAVHLLGGHRPPHGFLPSGSALRSVLSPNPDHPSRWIRHAAQPATIAVTGDGGEPGVGRWLFTPAPWCLAGSRDPDTATDLDGPARRSPGNEWLGIGLAAPIAEQNFTALTYAAVTDGFSLRLDYEGHTPVSGTFRAPRVLLRFGATDPYQVFAEHADLLRRTGLAPAPATGGAGWWRTPIFCGWGAQCQQAAARGGRGPLESTQANYDRYLAVLAGHGLSPSIVTVDDKWQREYARAEPDPRRWPDLAGWIADRHAEGRRVLLWWKAWDPEGAPAELCVRDARGIPVALDPGNPRCRDYLAEVVGHLLAPSGLGADGLKVDFTARTPSGASLRHSGTAWGAHLLHLLLETVHRAAKRARPDALVVTHAPNPAFADVTDMIRLNDARMMDAPYPDTDIVAHMTARARVVAAVCPGVPVDTDGWSMPDRAQWRAYLDIQPRLGVPALYYVDTVGDAAEPLRPDDYRAVADCWSVATRFQAGDVVPGR